jgi:hypothetical protein
MDRMERFGHHARVATTWVRVIVRDDPHVTLTQHRRKAATVLVSTKCLVVADCQCSIGQKRVQLRTRPHGALDERGLAYHQMRPKSPNIGCKQFR